MQIIAVRHGETDWNRQGRIQGRTDNPLNDTGRMQARAAAAVLPDKIGVIISSPLKRAAETAEIINKQRYNVEIITDERLTERDFGDYEGMFIKDLQFDVDCFRRWTDNIPTPNGETIREAAERVFGFLDWLKETRGGETALVVAHAHVIRPMYWYFNGIPTDGAAEKVFIMETGGIFYFKGDRR
jgi:broad specificity phosphatase PhoE